MTPITLALDPGQDLDACAWQVEAVRRNWKTPVRVIACAENDEAYARLTTLNVDELVLAGKVHANSPRDVEAAALSARISRIDRLRKACSAAGARQGHTLYLGPGCHAMQLAPVIVLAHEMSRRGKAFAARGRGFGDYAHDTPVGSFNPEFFMFDNDAARAASLWNFDLIDGLPHKVAVPGLLALRALGCLGALRCWRYEAADETTRNAYEWDSGHAFLRVDSRRLPDGLGAKLTAWHYREAGVMGGPAVAALLDRLDQSSPVKALEEANLRLAAFRQRLPSPGLADPGDVGAGLRVLAEFESAPRVARAARLCHARVRSWVHAVRMSLRERLVGGWVYRYRYGDMVWPNHLETVYRNAFAGVQGPLSLRAVSLDEPPGH